MGRTRGVFSSPQSEGARGFKSPSLQQAGSDLRHSLDNPAKFAGVRGFPHSGGHGGSCEATAEDSHNACSAIAAIGPTHCNTRGEVNGSPGRSTQPRKTL
jgi:hypothetical protein